MYRVYVGRVSHIAQQRDIERIFKHCGKIKEIIMKNGYAFVEFERESDAEDTVRELHGTVAFGQKIQVEHAKGVPRGEDLLRDIDRGYRLPSDRRDRGREERRETKPAKTYRIIVKNLSSRVTRKDLIEAMKKIGDVVYANAHRDRRHEGVVEFSSRRDMEKAIDKHDGYDFHGRKVEMYEEKSERSRSRSGSQRRGRSSSSRSRSRSYDKKRKSHRSRSRSGSKSKTRHSRSHSDSRKRRSRSRLSDKGRESRSRERSLKRRSADRERSSEGRKGSGEERRGSDNGHTENKEKSRDHSSDMQEEND